MTNGAVGEPSRESLYRGYSVAAPQNLTNNGAPHFFVDVKTWSPHWKEYFTDSLALISLALMKCIKNCSYRMEKGFPVIRDGTQIISVMRDRAQISRVRRDLA